MHGKYTINVSEQQQKDKILHTYLASLNLREKKKPRPNLLIDFKTLVKVHFVHMIIFLLIRVTSSR